MIYLICCLSLTGLSQNSSAIVEGNNQFAFRFFREMSKTSGENQFYSPFSISTALAMTYAGARHETENQMGKIMGFQSGPGFHKGFRQLLNNLDKGMKGSIKLTIANGLWAQKDYKFLESNFDLVKTYYHAELKSVDFTDTPERAKTLGEINSWVEEKTNGKIQDILAPGDLTNFTRLVLVNAIYFYGEWAQPFMKEATVVKPFSTPDGTQTNVPFMNRHGLLQYYEDSDFQAISIPYKDNKASMVIFLPVIDAGKPFVEKPFDYKYYQQIVESLKADQVNLSLPKFQTTCKSHLKNALTSMGMPLAFSPQADFSGMTGGNDLCISEVIHEAFIRTDEQGTEAAAATAVIMALTAAPSSRKVKVFKADHPFIFCITDNTTGSILFMGRIVKPEFPK
ncbi:MAG: serpin family protein [Bacteroidales bacterium]